MACGLHGRWRQEGGKLLAEELKRVRLQEGPEALLKLFEDEEQLPPHACPLHGQLSSENSTVVSLPTGRVAPLHAAAGCAPPLSNAMARFAELCRACGALGIGWHGLALHSLSRLAILSSQASRKNPGCYFIASPSLP